MSINFSSVGSATSESAVVSGTVSEVTTPQGVTLDLGKGTILDLSKQIPGLKNVMLGASWDVAQAGDDFDLDISAFLLRANGKIADANDIIYFNHMQASGIRLNGDNRTGAGDGDDETIDIELDSINPDVVSIVFAVNIYNAMVKRQTFGMVNNSKVRLVNKDDGDKEICRFSLKDDYSSSTAVIFAKLIKDNGSWKFETVGEGKVVRDLNDIVAMFS